MVKLSSESRILDSVAAVTECRDLAELEECFLNSLSEFVEVDALCLLRPRLDQENLALVVGFPRHDIDRFVKTVDTVHGECLIEPSPSMLITLLNAQMVVEEDNERGVFPILINGKIAYLLCLYGFSPSRASVKLIKGFAHIFGNFMGVLEEGERDTLTGLLNRKTFDGRLKQLMMTPLSEYHEGYEQRSSPHSGAKQNWLAIMDIDHFKRVNDNHGHVYGDEVLLQFSQLIKQTFREGDLLFRFGGEEFVVFAMGVDRNGAESVFERFRQLVESHTFPLVGQVTVSIGVSQVDVATTPAAMLDGADRALYFAKQSGRNRVCLYQDLIENGVLESRQVSDDIHLF